MNTTMPVQIGELIADRFRITGLAGVGGMGHVFRADDVASGLPVAVKLLHVDNDTTLRRFVRESNLLREVDHPNVVRYVADGELPSGERYLVMEWLEGEDLAARLKRGRLDIQGSVRLAIATSEALGALHDKGIVHRDVKPGNLFLVGRSIQALRLLDLGIAQSDKVTRMTRTGTVIGTLAYMAPEQARGDADVDARADVFALGCVLFECVTGTATFRGGNVSALLAKLLFVDAPRLRELVPQAPPELEQIVAAMLAKRRDERPADGDAVARALRELTAKVDLSPPPPTQPLSERWISTEARRRSSRRRATPVEGSPGDRGAAERSVRLAAPVATQLLPALTLPRRSRGLSDAERKLLCLILVAPKEGAGSEDDAALAGVAEAWGGHFVRLLDGSAAVLITGPRVATDLAARAAMAALALRDRAPGRSIAVATGFSDVLQRLPNAALIDAAAALLGDEAPSRVALDGTTAALLDLRFDLVREGGSAALRGLRGGDEERPLAGAAPECFGRARELRALEGLFEDCASEGRAQVAVVKGPPGVGKSRLMRELVRSIRARGEPVSIWPGRADEVRGATPLRLLSELMHAAGGSGLGDSSEGGTAFVERARAECAARPLMIVIDDLQWGDAVTAQVLDRALGVLSERPLFVLAFARPEVDDTFPKLWAKRRAQEIRLLELPRKAAERMARRALGEDHDAAAVERILELAAGNAYALEELIRAASEGHEDGLPEALVAMEQSSLGALDAAARRLLRAASVFEGPFSSGDVAALLGGSPRPEEVAAGLSALAQQEVLLVSSSEGPPAEGERYSFRHVLQREAAYAMLTVDDFVLGHRLAAERLEHNGELDALVLARHFEAAGERERASAYYKAAVQQDDPWQD